MLLILIIFNILFEFRDREGSPSKQNITVEMDPPKVALEVLSYHNAASIEEVCSRDFNISFSSSEMLCFFTCLYLLFILLQVEEILTTNDTDEPIEEIAS